MSSLKIAQQFQQHGKAQDLPRSGHPMITSKTQYANNVHENNPFKTTESQLKK